MIALKEFFRDLEQVSMIALKEFFRDDMTTRNKAKGLFGLRCLDFAEDLIDPRSGRIDDAFGGHGFSRALMFYIGAITFVYGFNREDFCARANICSAIGGVQGIEHDQPCIFDPAV